MRKLCGSTFLSSVLIITSWSLRKYTSQVWCIISNLTFWWKRKRARRTVTFGTFINCKWSKRCIGCCRRIRWCYWWIRSSCFWYRSFFLRYKTNANRRVDRKQKQEDDSSKVFEILVITKFNLSIWRWNGRHKEDDLEKQGNWDGARILNNKELEME